MRDSAMRTLESFRQYVTAPGGAGITALSRVLGIPRQALQLDLDILVEGGLLATPTEGLYALTHRGWNTPGVGSSEGDDEPWISFTSRTPEPEKPRRDPRDRRR